MTPRTGKINKCLFSETASATRTRIDFLLIHLLELVRSFGHNRQRVHRPLELVAQNRIDESEKKEK